MTEALAEYLIFAKSYSYGPATNWLDIAQLVINTNVDGSVVSSSIVMADYFDAATIPSIKSIYDKLETDGKIDEFGMVAGTGGAKDATQYAIDSYVMNTFARYMGALGHDSESLVTKIQFNGEEYTWNEDKNLKASNWFSGETSLISAVVSQQNTAIRDVSLKVFDSNTYFLDVKIDMINVPTIEEYNRAINAEQ